MKQINEKELKELFIELKNDNKMVFEKLYNKYNKLVYGIAFSILKNKEDSEDVVQNVMSKLYNLDKSKLPISKEASWLYTVTKNEAISIIRKKDKEINLEDIYEIDNNNEIENIIDKENFNKLISNLNEKEKEIISLKVISNLSFKEIEKLIGEPINTIKWRYYNSIYKLKQLLSNVTMFIVTFIVGIFTMKNKDKITNHVSQDSVTQENENYRNETTTPTFNKTELDSALKGDTEKSEVNKENVIQETVVESEIIKKENYLGIGILSISVIFLIVTIITLIFFKKYQLKSKVKLSK